LAKIEKSFSAMRKDWLIISLNGKIGGFKPDTATKANKNHTNKCSTTAF
jgi:hypothetical protein